MPEVILVGLEEQAKAPVVEGQMVMEPLMLLLVLLLVVVVMVVQEVHQKQVRMAV